MMMMMILEIRHGCPCVCVNVCVCGLALDASVILAMIFTAVHASRWMVVRWVYASLVQICR